jgi:hypothetical protein
MREHRLERFHVGLQSVLSSIADHKDTFSVEDAAVKHEITAKPHGFDQYAVRPRPRSFASHLAMETVAIGRNNWTFAGSEGGGKAMAIAHT